MLFKLSNLNSNLALTLGHLKPALNNSAQYFIKYSLVMQKQLLKVQVSKAAIFSCKATTINLENCKIHRHWNEY